MESIKKISGNWSKPYSKLKDSGIGSVNTRVETDDDSFGFIVDKERTPKTFSFSASNDNNEGGNSPPAFPKPVSSNCDPPFDLFEDWNWDKKPQPLLVAENKYINGFLSPTQHEYKKEGYSSFIDFVVSESEKESRKKEIICSPSANNQSQQLEKKKKSKKKVTATELATLLQILASNDGSAYNQKQIKAMYEWIEDRKSEICSYASKCSSSAASLSSVSTNQEKCEPKRRRSISRGSLDRGKNEVTNENNSKSAILSKSRSKSRTKDRGETMTKKNRLKSRSNSRSKLRQNSPSKDRVETTADKPRSLSRNRNKNKTGDKGKAIKKIASKHDKKDTESRSKPRTRTPSKGRQARSVVDEFDPETPALVRSTLRTCFKGGERSILKTRSRPLLELLDDILQKTSLAGDSDEDCDGFSLPHVPKKEELEFIVGYNCTSGWGVSAMRAKKPPELR